MSEQNSRLWSCTHGVPMNQHCRACAECEDEGKAKLATLQQRAERAEAELAKRRMEATPSDHLKWLSEQYKNEAAEYHKRWKAGELELQTAQSTITELTDRVERMREDTERLDFLEGKRYSIQGTLRRVSRCVFGESDRPSTYLFSKPSLREAIDAAREKARTALGGEK